MRITLHFGSYYLAFSNWSKQNYWKFNFQAFALDGGYPVVEIQAGKFIFEICADF